MQNFKGLAGVVIDGAVRDYDDLMKIKFPIFSRYIVPNAGEPKGFGEIGAEITCGSQTVRTGDWIIGDDSGVVVVPQEIAQEIANRALDVKEQENRIREEIKQGGSLGSVLKLKNGRKKSDDQGRFFYRYHKITSGACIYFPLESFAGKKVPVKLHMGEKKKPVFCET